MEFLISLATAFEFNDGSKVAGQKKKKLLC